MHVIHDDGAGGGPVAVKHLMDYLRPDYDQSFAHGGDGIAAAWCRDQGLPEHRVPLHRKLLIPAGLIALFRLLRRVRPDAVIVYGQWGGPVGALAARMAGIGNVIYITHFPAFYTDWDLFRVVRNRLVEAIPCRLSRYVVLPSEGNYYQYLVRHLITEEKALVINSSISRDVCVGDEGRRRLRETHGWHDDECHVVSVSRLSDQKRVDWLLRSWKTVCEEEPGARLWIVGSGSEEAALKRLAEDLKLAGVTFLGAQPEGARYVAAADIVAMTSMYEGHAHVPLEAMVNGKPVVASDVDGVRESFTDGREGFLVPPGDTRRFAERLIELIRSPELRREMGCAGLSRAKDFAPDRLYPRYVSSINTLLRGDENDEQAPEALD